MSVQTGKGSDWDTKGRVRSGPVDGVLGLDDRARGTTVAVSAIWGTTRSGGSPFDNAAAKNAFPCPKLSTVSAGSEVPVLESCSTAQRVADSVVAKATA